jgi:hypothetical protein
MARTVLIDGEEYEVEDDAILSQEEEDPVESESVLDRIRNTSGSLLQGLEQATRGLESSGLGLLDYGSDALGYTDNPFEGLIARRNKEKVDARNPEYEGTGYQTVSDITENVAPVLGAGIATGGVGLPAALGGLKGFSDQYQESEDNGQSFKDASLQAGVRGLGEAASNAIETIPIFKAGSAAKRLLGSSIYGAGGNVLSTASDLVADNAFKDNPEWSDDIGRSAGEGAIMGAALGSVAEGVNYLGAKTLPKGREQQADLEIDNLKQQLLDEQAAYQETQGLNPEVLPEATPSDNLSADNFPVIEQATLQSLEGVNPEEVPLPEVLTTKPDIIDEVITESEPTFVQEVKNQTLKPTENNVPVDFPEQPISKVESEQVAKTPEPKKYEIKTTPKTSEFDAPIKDNGVQSPIELPSVKYVEPKTGEQLLLPFEPEVKGRLDTINKDADVAEEVLKQLDRVQKRESQRGSFSFKKTKEAGTWAERTKGAKEFDSDKPWGGVTSTARKLLTMPRTLAEKYPAFMPAYQAASEGIPRHFGTKLISLKEKGSAYWDLPSAKREVVNKFLQAERRAVAEGGGRISPSNEKQLAARGLDTNQINAILGVRNMMDDALDTMSDAWKVKTRNRTDVNSANKDEIERAIDSYVKSLKGKGYVPDMRFGKFYVEARDAKGSLTHYAFRSSKKEVELLAKQLASENPSLKIEKGARETIPDEMYEDLPADLGGYLYFLEQGRPTKLPKGVMGNFIQARHIDGADADLSRSLATYIQGVSKYSARANYDPIINKSVSALKETDPQAAAQAVNYVNDTRASSSKAKMLWNEYLVPFYNFQYLSGNVANITLNALEPFMSTYPQIGYHLKDVPGVMPFASERIAVKSLGDTVMSPLSSKNFNPELRAAIDYAKQSGFLNDSAIRDIYDISRGRKSAPMTAMKKLAEITSGGNAKVEDLVKYYDYVTGFNVAKARGLAGQEAFDYAMFFTNDVKSSGRKAEQNMLFRRAPVFGLFRNYTANQYRQLLRSTRNRDVPTLLRQLAPALGLAGVQGLPGFKELLSGYDLFSDEGDWKSSVRKGAEDLGASNKLADYLIYGAPGAELEWVYSNTAGFTGLLPPSDGTNSGAEAFGKMALGATYAPISQAQRALQLYSSGRGDLALERMSPILGKQILKGARTIKDGQTDAKGNLLKKPEDLTLGDIAANFTNTTTLDLAKRYEARNTTAKMSREANNKSKSFNDRIFWAHIEGDYKKRDDLRRQAEKEGIASSSIARAFTARMKEYKDSTNNSLSKTPKRLRKEAKENVDRIYR